MVNINHSDNSDNITGRLAYNRNTTFAAMTTITADNIDNNWPRPGDSEANSTGQSTSNAVSDDKL